MAVDYKISVDFEVYRQLTLRRETEEMTSNDVLRQMFGLPPAKKVETANEIKPQVANPVISALTQSDPVRLGESRLLNLLVHEYAWVTKGVAFPNGTMFEATYKGESNLAQVDKGALVVKGVRYTSASSAAKAITGVTTNGWRFWRVYVPSKGRFVEMELVRQMSAPRQIPNDASQNMPFDQKISKASQESE